jgi:hypothetical protein
MAANDRTHMTDGISASLEAEVVPPSYPCPKCGAESRPHGEGPRHDESERICSAATCRKVQPAPKEVIGGAARFPCAACGRETKQYRSGRAGQPTERVCSNTSCRNIFNM